MNGSCTDAAIRRKATGGVGQKVPKFYFSFTHADHEDVPTNAEFMAIMAHKGVIATPCGHQWTIRLGTALTSKYDLCPACAAYRPQGCACNKDKGGTSRVSSSEKKNNKKARLASFQ